MLFTSIETVFLKLPEILLNLGILVVWAKTLVRLMEKEVLKVELSNFIRQSTEKFLKYLDHFDRHHLNV